MTEEERKAKKQAYMREYSKKYRARPENLARKRELANAWNAAHPEERKAKAAAYRARNREQCRQGQAKWRNANPERKREHAAKYRAANREQLRAKSAEYHQRTKDSKREYFRTYYQKIKHKRRAYVESKGEQLKECKRRWQQANKERLKQKRQEWKRANQHVIVAHRLRRRAAERQAMPAWADQEAIRAFYVEAERLTRATGIVHEVDHIYPIQGKTVSGLHVAANLQILTKAENIRKRNKHPDDVTLHTVRLPEPSGGAESRS